MQCGAILYAVFQENGDTMFRQHYQVSVQRYLSRASSRSPNIRNVSTAEHKNIIDYMNVFISLFLFKKLFINTVLYYVRPKFNVTIFYTIDK